MQFSQAQTGKIAVWLPECLAELAEAVEDESGRPATAVDTHRQLVGFGRGHKLPPI